MGYDDGIIKIYEKKVVSGNGCLPKEGLKYKSSFYFGYETLGVTRNYMAKQNNTKIESVVKICGDRTVSANDICVFEDGSQFVIDFIQHGKNELGLDETHLTLVKGGDEYEMLQS